MTAGFRFLTVSVILRRKLFEFLDATPPKKSDTTFDNNLQKQRYSFQSTFLRIEDTVLGNFSLYFFSHVFSQVSLVLQVLFCESQRFES